MPAISAGKSAVSFCERNHQGHNGIQGATIWSGDRPLGDCSWTGNDFSAADVLAADCGLSACSGRSCGRHPWFGSRLARFFYVWCLWPVFVPGLFMGMCRGPPPLEFCLLLFWAGLGFAAAALHKREDQGISLVIVLGILSTLQLVVYLILLLFLGFVF